MAVLLSFFLPPFPLFSPRARGKEQGSTQTLLRLPRHDLKLLEELGTTT